MVKTNYGRYIYYKKGKGLSEACKENILDMYCEDNSLSLIERKVEVLERASIKNVIDRQIISLQQKCIQEEDQP